MRIATTARAGTRARTFSASAVVRRRAADSPGRSGGRATRYRFFRPARSRERIVAARPRSTSVVKHTTIAMAVARPTSAARVRTGSDRRASRPSRAREPTGRDGMVKVQPFRGSPTGTFDDRAAALGPGLALHRDDRRDGRMGCRTRRSCPSERRGTSRWRARRPRARRARCGWRWIRRRPGRSGRPTGWPRSGSGRPRRPRRSRSPRPERSAAGRAWASSCCSFPRRRRRRRRPRRRRPPRSCRPRGRGLPAAAADFKAAARVTTAAAKEDDELDVFLAKAGRRRILALPGQADRQPRPSRVNRRAP